ncbi:MAG: D-alanine--D-alanine ligase [Cytophagales bacterium]|mgnify:CR=1 FL=1|jgi:D-alanine-D-alanine ligase|nr:D-alanine--D-alanine ligase [Bacteroidota bacterium]MBS1980281.1 D-alanine--D-alanine ligase [Bacteroidota bacterium]WHZ08805.1 MAG: D-alanine--D-alanine ligase [Cytophagales bacterium]
MRKKIAILYGGRSVEHGVSVNSAKNIFQFIDRKKFEPIAIGITEEGTWYHTEKVTSKIKKGEKMVLSLDASKPFFKASKIKLTPDVIFPALHGTDGEDGSIQGLIKALDLPMVGTGVLGSAMSMNKLIAKKILKQAGIPTTEFISFSYDERSAIRYDEIKKQLGLPFMVKSASLGSSVGVSKVSSEKDFKKAVHEAFRYDDCMLIEKFVKGREIECAVLGNDPPQASLPGEIVISKKYEFYTFDAKYVDGQAVQIKVPARLEEKTSKKIQELSVKTYQVLQCEDFARVDLFLTKDGKVYVNEINTIPGFTNSSMFPMMWKERGVSFTELITRLIELAEIRYKKLQRVKRGYTSELKY